MIKISKELLSEVMQLGILEVGEVDDCYLSFNYYILDDDNIKACINIYELAYKCKEWLKNNVSNANSGFDNGHRNFCYIENYNIQDTFYADTEIEAVIKACEWILNKLNKKD